MATNQAGARTIDLTLFRKNRTHAAEVAREIAEACQDNGFLVVTGHGVPASLVRDLRRAALQFFQQPLANKLKYAPVAEKGAFGYYAPRTSAVARSRGDMTEPDLKERFVIEPDSYQTTGAWPTMPPDFRALTQEYRTAMESLSDELISLFALALGLPGDYFLPKMSDRKNRFSLIHYLPTDETPDNTFGVGAHSDYGALTILQKEAGVGGLQVQGTDGDWVDIEPLPDAFIVNIGDLMERWTNDRWVSTMHRVVAAAPGTQDGTHMISLVYFVHPNPDTLIEPVPTCVTVDSPAKHPPVLAGDHVKVQRQRSTLGPPAAM